MEERPIVLVGMMGAGKSAVGRLLARRLGRPFVDADGAIESRTGRSVPELFAAVGEDGFRDVEAEVLHEVLQRRPPVVLAAGGGAVVRPTNRRALRDGATVVWLQASTEHLLPRVGTGRGRPLLRDDPAGTLSRLQDERGPWYAEVAHLTLDTTAGRPEVLVEELLRALAGTGAVAVGELP